MQLAARTPAATAMALATLDQLAGGGRVIGGLGVSGPQIVEGWYGQPWGRPNAQLRDYVAIMRKVFAREAPVAHEGAEISLPYAGAGASGSASRCARSCTRTRSCRSGSARAAQANVKLTAEIADGWLPMGFVPGMLDDTTGRGSRKASRRAGGGKARATSRSRRGAQVDDHRRRAGGARAQKPTTALYVGGMGHRRR